MSERAANPFDTGSDSRRHRTARAAALVGCAAVLVALFVPWVSMNEPRYDGTRIGRVAPDSPAAFAGFLPGDVVTAIDGQPVSDWSELVHATRSRGARPLSLTVRRGNETLVIDATPIGEPPHLGILVASRADWTSMSPARLAKTWWQSLHWFPPHNAPREVVTVVGPVGVAGPIPSAAMLIGPILVSTAPFFAVEFVLVLIVAAFLLGRMRGAAIIGTALLVAVGARIGAVLVALRFVHDAAMFARILPAWCLLEVVGIGLACSTFAWKRHARAATAASGNG